MKKFVSAFLLVSLLCTIMIGSVSASGVTGDGGYACIESLDSQELFTWSVIPDTMWPYNFHGEVNMTNIQNGKTGWAYAGGSGLLGSKCSGTCSASGLGSGTVFAELTGTAYALSGGEFVVLPGVSDSMYVK